VARLGEKGMRTEFWCLNLSEDIYWKSRKVITLRWIGL